MKIIDKVVGHQEKNMFCKKNQGYQLHKQDGNPELLKEAYLNMKIIDKVVGHQEKTCFEK